ncbi:MAG: hypothetical protein PW845_03965 [Pseudomonas sp.]|nr:hypothetical protein [Pseudomonas sp.]
MFSKMTQALILSGCLVAAGAASAHDRDVIVPVIAGAAVGAVVAAVISGPGQNHYYRPQYQGYQPQYRYPPQYQPVAYVVPQRVEYRRYAPPPPRGYYGPGYGRW